jgi:hypothetical protein
MKRERLNLLSSENYEDLNGAFVGENTAKKIVS